MFNTEAYRGIKKDIADIVSLLRKATEMDLEPDPFCPYWARLKGRLESYEDVLKQFDLYETRETFLK